MTDVISLAEWRAKREGKTPEDAAFTERLSRIRRSIDTINRLMAELRKNSEETTT